MRTIIWIACWTIQVMLAAFFLLAGVMKLAGAEQISQEFRNWGYGDTFRLIIGLIESLGGVGLLIPRLAAFCAIGLMLVMGGAVYTHLAADQGLNAALPAMVLILLLGVIAYLRRGSRFGRDHHE